MTHATAILDVLRNYDAMQRANRDFVREHQWSQTLAPLRAFVNAPRFDPAKEAFAVSFHVPEQRPTLLQRILEQVGGEHADAAPSCFDDAAWVGWRLTELLPLENLQRQALLQQDDPHARLDSLLALLP